MNFSYPCFPAVPQTRYPIQRRCKRVAALRESAQITAWNFLFAVISAYPANSV